MIRPSLILLFGVTVVVLGACAPQSPLLGNPQAPYPPPTKPQVGDILHLRTGHFVSAGEMASAATDSRIIYVAETHDNPASHRVQLDLLKALAQRYPGRTAVAMEMFTPAQQDTLDAWVANALDEKNFLKLWYSSWKMDFAYYRDILNYCREAGIPIIGINAEKSMVQAVGRKDFAALTAEEQARLPTTLDPGDPYHQALTAAIFGGHMQGKPLDGFQRVQTLWDETMAGNIVRFLTSPQGDDIHLLVLAGGNHVRYGFGIPRRVFKQLPLSYTLIGNEELEVSEAKKKEAYMDVKLPNFPMPAYDYLVFTRYEELEKKDDVKLGIMLAEKEGKVIASGILPNGAAALAGVQTGDVLRRLDGEELTESFDLIYALKQKKIGEKGQLTVERGGETLLLDLTYTATPPLEEMHHKP
ncbi:MAG: hypothetical protein CVU69_06115 [Deltaproteobacteria bacterium HGW-Deltaproteobacteria-4]|nr:MAG: hypothetical protein CVU69_06115 [Deltaproteobacteria bacterium HGW-Deltaproteobacteria-4]